MSRALYIESKLRKCADPLATPSMFFRSTDLPLARVPVGFNQCLLSLCYPLLKAAAPSINFGNILGMPGIQPGAAGCKARMLSIVPCSPPPPPSVNVWNSQLNKNPFFQRNSPKACVYWDIHASEWSNQGCQLDKKKVILLFYVRSCQQRWWLRAL